MPAQARPPGRRIKRSFLSAEVQVSLSAEVRRLLALDETYSAEAEALRVERQRINI
jgi:hypothetical protein